MGRRGIVGRARRAQRNPEHRRQLPPEPRHTDMRHVRIGKPEPLVIDDRLKRLFGTP